MRSFEEELFETMMRRSFEYRRSIEEGADARTQTMLLDAWSALMKICVRYGLGEKYGEYARKRLEEYERTGF